MQVATEARVLVALELKLQDVFDVRPLEEQQALVTVKPSLLFFY